MSHTGSPGGFSGLLFFQMSSGTIKHVNKITEARQLGICQESSASAVTQSWAREPAVICELSQYMSAQVKFILLLPTEQQQEAAPDWEPPLCFPGASLLLFPVQYYEFFIKPTAISCLFQTVKNVNCQS